MIQTHKMSYNKMKHSVTMGNKQHTAFGEYNVKKHNISFTGCIPQNRLNYFDLDDKNNIDVKAQRQNVVFGCPCETGECANNGTCMNSTTLLANSTTSWKMCKCVGSWTGPRCQKEDDLLGLAPREYFVTTKAMQLYLFQLWSHKFAVRKQCSCDRPPFFNFEVTPV